MWWRADTACAFDSRKFGAWFSNLMTEWQQRFRGPGVVMYWHAERKSVCIYSQLTSCSASEVASVIEGDASACRATCVSGSDGAIRRPAGPSRRGADRTTTAERPREQTQERGAV